MLYGIQMYIIVTFFTAFEVTFITIVFICIGHVCKYNAYIDYLQIMPKWFLDKYILKKYAATFCKDNPRFAALCSQWVF